MSPRAGIELLQHEMLHLAQRGSRQVSDKDDIARHLEASQLALDMGFQIFRFEPAALTFDFGTR